MLPRADPLTLDDRFPRCRRCRIEMGEENLLRTPAVRYDIHLTDFSNLQMYSAFVSCLVLITNHTIDNRSQIATTRRKKKKKKKERKKENINIFPIFFFFFFFF